MSCIGYFAGTSVIHRLDARGRLVAALAMAVLVAWSVRLSTAAWALAPAVLLAILARLAVRPLLLRMLRLNVFVLALWLVLPWSAAGEATGTLAGLPIVREGVDLALGITLKANAIVLLFTALVATIAPSQLGAAFHHLAVPDKLVHLFVLAVRYTDVLHREYGRLREAMKGRAFVLTFSRHTLRTLGYLVGLLLVRGMERSERILAAMKCRGFDGRFRTVQPESWAMRDAIFGMAAAGLIGIWWWMESL